MWAKLFQGYDQGSLMIVEFPLGISPDVLVWGDGTEPQNLVSVFDGFFDHVLDIFRELEKSD